MNIYVSRYSMIPWSTVVLLCIQVLYDPMVRCGPFPLPTTTFQSHSHQLRSQYINVYICKYIHFRRPKISFKDILLYLLFLLFDYTNLFIMLSHISFCFEGNLIVTLIIWASTTRHFLLVSYIREKRLPPRTW